MLIPPYRVDKVHRVHFTQTLAKITMKNKQTPEKIEGIEESIYA